jgi:hypothetical protein
VAETAVAKTARVNPFSRANNVIMEIARMRAKYMPVHDWTRVVSGNFHDFHQRWVGAIRDALNDGRMPEGYYALAEQVAEGPKPDVVALETRSDNSSAIDPKSLDERSRSIGPSSEGTVHRRAGT